MILPAVKAIVAVDLNEGIGYRGRLPWPRIPADMAHFKRTTSENGAAIVVGRKTWDTLPNLPGRTIYVLSHSTPGAVRTPEEAISLAAQAGDRTLYVAGGAETYRAFAPYTSEIILTRVLDIFEADTRFPFEAFGDRWDLVETLHKDDRCVIARSRRGDDRVRSSLGF